MTKGKISKNFGITEKLTTISIDELFGFIKQNPDSKTYEFKEFNHVHKLKRAILFSHLGTKCVQCELEGQYFSLEKWKDGGIHLDLIAIDDVGDEMFMTIDHIHPVSKGGANNSANKQVMCKVCNETKSDTITVCNTEILNVV